MTELDEFRILVGRAKRKLVKEPEDEALIAAGRFIERVLWEKGVIPEHWHEVFLEVGSRLDK